MRHEASRKVYDAVVIGSGFGGAMTAHALVRAGQEVLLLERGDWVARGPDNWRSEAVGMLTPYYSTETPYRALGAGGERTVGAFHCVGGPSVFYGGVSLRFRAEDFEPDPEIAGASGARWPYAYSELEPYYTRAEEILLVAGQTGADPTEPPRSRGYPQPPPGLSPVARRIEAAALALGLRPFQLPLAINHAAGPRACRGCGTCDGFACAVEAKNDLATVVLRPLLGRGLDLRTNTVVTRLVTDGLRVAGVDWVDRISGAAGTSHGRRVVLSAGALASPHLLLASGLVGHNPGGHTVGRYLMRHYNRIVFGIFPRPLEGAERFHKQLGIHDFYFGHPSVRNPRGKLGGIQQLATPPAGLVRAHLPRILAPVCSAAVGHLTGLLVIAEDQPHRENRVYLDRGATDRFGLPRLVISHRYTERDLQAGRALVAQAKAILRRAGAWAFYCHPIGTFSHAVGTVRMGADPRTSALDPECRFRGLENLWVADASAMPTAAGVNPSLTIAANALRAAEALLARSLTARRARRHAFVRR